MRLISRTCSSPSTAVTTASRSVLLETLRQARRSILWWSVGLAGLVAMIVAVFPSVRGNAGLNQLVKNYPEALKAFLAFGGTVDYTSAAGYLGSELFSFMVPLLLVVAAIGAGARAVAGEEEQGTLELLLATPLSRRRLVAEKAGALAVELVVLSGVLFGTLAVGTRLAGMEIGVTRLAAASLSGLLLALLFGALALLAGAASGRRPLATAVPAAIAVASYFANALGLVVTGLRPLRHVSPFYHYAAGDPLREGFALDHAMLLAAATLVFAALAPAALQRRDLR